MLTVIGKNEIKKAVKIPGPTHGVSKVKSNDLQGGNMHANSHCGQIFEAKYIHLVDAKLSAETPMTG
jgi:hypothetical protein